MIGARELNEQGLLAFRSWLGSISAPAPPPAALVESDLYTRPFGSIQIDDSRKFKSRLEFGKYLVEAFKDLDSRKLLDPSHDGLWAWLTVIYFSQLAPSKLRHVANYIVTRKGAAGSLTHRHAVRTAFMLVSFHGDNAQICLSKGMHVHGQLLESLSAKQSVALNKGFFGAATLLYMQNGKLRKGATSKPKDPAARKPGETTGMGSVRRLPLALERLDLTYDVESLEAASLVAKLPREFSHWSKT